MKQIDVQAIVAEPVARLRFLKEFVGFTEDDRGAMAESLFFLGDGLPRILDGLYDHLLGHDDTRRLFLGAEGRLDPEYLALRKEHLTEWILLAAASPTPDDFAPFMLQVAAQHLGQEGSRGRAVPPRYVVAATSFLQTAFTSAIFAALPEEPARALRMTVAWNKFLVVQLELFLCVIAPHWPEWDERGSRREAATGVTSTVGEA